MVTLTHNMQIDYASYNVLKLPNNHLPIPRQSHVFQDVQHSQVYLEKLRILSALANAYLLTLPIHTVDVVY